MVLEQRHRGGGIGEREGEEERRRNEIVESWSAVVPLDQTMMGLYYPAILPVSSSAVNHHAMDCESKVLIRFDACELLVCCSVCFLC